MFSGKNRINVTQIRKSQGCCLWEPKALSRAVVGAIPADPWVWSHCPGAAKPRGSDLNPPLSGVSLLSYFFLFNCLARGHPHHWWNLRIVFSSDPRHTNKGSLRFIRDSTALQPWQTQTVSTALFTSQLFSSDLLTCPKSVLFLQVKMLNVVPSHTVCFIVFTSTALTWTPTSSHMT